MQWLRIMYDILYSNHSLSSQVIMENKKAGLKVEVRAKLIMYSDKVEENQGKTFSFNMLHFLPSKIFSWVMVYVNDFITTADEGRRICMSYLILSIRLDNPQ